MPTDHPALRTVAVAVARRAVHESLIGLSAWAADEVRAKVALLESAVRAAALAEAGVALTARHCCPESVDLVRHMINHQLCPDCEGYGQTVTDMPDGGIIRRCRTCNRAGLVPLAATAPTSQES